MPPDQRLDHHQTTVEGRIAHGCTRVVYKAAMLCISRKQRLARAGQGPTGRRASEQLTSGIVSVLHPVRGRGLCLVLSVLRPPEFGGLFAFCPTPGPTKTGRPKKNRLSGLRLFTTSNPQDCVEFGTGCRRQRPRVRAPIHSPIARQSIASHSP